MLEKQILIPTLTLSCWVIRASKAFSAIDFLAFKIIVLEYQTLQIDVLGSDLKNWSEGFFCLFVFGGGFGPWYLKDFESENLKETYIHFLTR